MKLLILCLLLSGCMVVDCGHDNLSSPPSVDSPEGLYPTGVYGG